MNNSSAIQTPFYNFPEYKAAKNLWIFLSPPMMILGILCSCLSIVVLVRKRIRTKTTMFYLTVVSALDILVLLTGLLRQWIRYTFDLDIRMLGVTACKIHAYLVYISVALNTWVLVAVTIDRYLHVCFPFKAVALCTIGIAHKTVIGLAVGIMLVHFHMWFTVSIKHQLEGSACSFTVDFVIYAWPKIDLCLNCLLPFAAMLICNAMIIRGIIIAKRRVAVDATEQTNPSTNKPVDDKKGNSHTDKERITSLTKMLLTVNCTFLILNTPSQVYEIVEPYVLKSASEHTIAKVELAYAFVYVLFYVNYVIHFFLYCLTSPIFMAELKGIVQRYKVKHAHTEETVTVDVDC